MVFLFGYAPNTDIAVDRVGTDKDIECPGVDGGIGNSDAFVDSTLVPVVRIEAISLASLVVDRPPKLLRARRCLVREEFLDECRAMPPEPLP